jgi:hypothetical protein
MLEKCANHSCSTPFLYLSKGKLFTLQVAPEKRRNLQGFERFWLCDSCAATMTLVFREGKLTTLPLERPAEPNRRIEPHCRPPHTQCA